jgi:Double-GTPase 2
VATYSAERTPDGPARLELAARRSPGPRLGRACGPGRPAAAALASGALPARHSARNVSQLSAVGSGPPVSAVGTASAVQAWTASDGSLVIVLAVIGILVGVVLSAISLAAGLARHPNLITPSAYRAERIRAHPVGAGQFEPDLAWPFYPLRQVRADLARVGAEWRARYVKLWHWPGRPVIWVLFAPVSAAAGVCLLVAGLTTLVVAGLFALVAWACAAVTTVVFAALVLLLRGAERAWRRRMRTEASCPHCYHVTPWPAYRCPGCSRLHRDVRPGRLGLFTRRCECGTLLPTMVLRAARRLEAVCQRCSEPLRAGSAAFRDVRIPIFGDTSAGKTRFLYAGLDSLIDTTTRADIALGFPDEESQNQATAALDLIRSGRDTVKTSLMLPTALTCRVGNGSDSTLVHLFDAAGEFYRDAQVHDALGFLDRGHGLVYVLDPFSVGTVRDRIAGQNATVIRLAHAAAGDPETAYGEVVSRLRDSGVKAAKQRLAVVVSKADLLSASGIEPPDDSAAIADWLMAMGVHNLVLSARREFAEVRYFAVASLVPAQGRSTRDPGAPLRWLLASYGMRLPTEQDETTKAQP